MSNNGYHHGELPVTLMELALKHIADHGTEKLSLRALAREAGVSPTAPYRHFASKQCLLASIGAQGFATLRAEHARTLAAELSVEQQMYEMAHTYVRFALDNPVCYQIMFGSLLGDFSEYEMLQNAAAAAYEDVDKTLRAIIEKRGLNVDAALLGGTMWSFLHGLSSLLINAPNLAQANTKPMQALSAVQKDPDAALKFMFAELVGVEERSRDVS